MPSPSELAVDLLSEALLKQDIVLKENVREAFSTYASMLVDWNANRFNLTRLVAPEQIALNHFLDSLVITKFVKIPLGATLIDLGTGAGFPGLALKIYRPDIKLILVDSTSKKLTFCRAVGDALCLESVDFIHGRAEDPSTLQQIAAKGTIVTARAVAELKCLLGWASPLIAPSGVFVAWKGAKVFDEVADAQSTAHRLALKMDVFDQVLSVAGVDPVIHYYVVCRSRR